MRKMLWVLCGLALAAPTHGAPSAGCMTGRDAMLKMATMHDCPEEEAEAKAITCEGTGIKDAKRLQELTKLCRAKPDKGASSSSSSTKPAVDMKTTDLDLNELPEGEHKCRGVDAKGNVLATFGTDKSSIECIGGIKRAVGEKLCADGKLGFTLQTYRDGKWSKGIEAEARCKK
jgi:hypothetical protein